MLNLFPAIHDNCCLLSLLLVFFSGMHRVNACSYLMCCLKSSCYLSRSDSSRISQNGLKRSQPCIMGISFTLTLISKSYIVSLFLYYLALTFFRTMKLSTNFAGADPGFLEMGFIYTKMYVWGGGGLLC